MVMEPVIDSPVEGVECKRTLSNSPQSSQSIQSLVCCLVQCSGVSGPAEVLTDVHTKESEENDLLYL